MDTFHDIIYSNEWAIPVMFQYIWNHAISSGPVPTSDTEIWGKSYKFTGIVVALSVLFTNVGNIAVSCDPLTTATSTVCQHI